MGQTPGIASPVLPALPETPPALRACLFSLASARFAVDVRSAREVAVFDEITAIPGAPRHLVGVANLRGTVLPIAELGLLLGLPELRQARSVRTLVLRDGALVAAVVVDAVLGLEPFNEIVPADSPTVARVKDSRQFVAGWLAWAGEMLPLLDVPRLLAALRPTMRADGPARGGPA